jgi:hypothetical protein
MRVEFLWRAIAHTMVCFIYPVAIYLLQNLYEKGGGVVSSRGVAAGLASQWVWLVVVVCNGLIACLSNIRFKLLIMVIMMLCMFLYLMPVHPLRAFAYVGAAGVLTLSAILVVKYGAEAGSKTGL